MISVIIRCKNEAMYIGHSIQSVLDNVTQDAQIIVVDNRSSDDSVEIVKMFEHHADIKRIDIDDYSPGKSINLGVNESKYQHILILSAHCVITKMTTKINEYLSKYVAVFGQQIPVFRGRKISRRYLWSNFVEYPVENMFSDQEKRYFLHNACCFYNREFLLMNKFDETLYGKEDRYWVNDMISNGFRTYYTPEIQCVHHWTSNGATWKGIG